MTRGSIVKVVSSFGSEWGRIRPDNDVREVFFNAASLRIAVPFSSIEIGQEVEFDEQDDHVTGTHAKHVVLVDAEAKAIST